MLVPFDLDDQIWQSDTSGRISTGLATPSQRAGPSIPQIFGTPYLRHTV